MKDKKHSQKIPFSIRVYGEIYTTREKGSKEKVLRAREDLINFNKAGRRGYVYRFRVRQYGNTWVLYSR